MARPLAEEQYGQFSARVCSRTIADAQPTRVQFELTYRCNIHCVHCYTDPFNTLDAVGRELDLHEISRIFDELADAGLRFARQVPVPLTYKGCYLGEYRLDLLLEEAVVVEVKAVERFDPVHEAQLLTYLRLTGKRVGLLVNFNRRLLPQGIQPPLPG